MQELTAERMPVLTPASRMQVSTLANRTRALTPAMTREWIRALPTADPWMRATQTRAALMVIRDRACPGASPHPVRSSQFLGSLCSGSGLIRASANCLAQHASSLQIDGFQSIADIRGSTAWTSSLTGVPLELQRPGGTYERIRVQFRKSQCQPKVRSAHLGFAPWSGFFAITVSRRDDHLPRARPFEAGRNCRRSIRNPSHLRKDDGGPLLCARFQCGARQALAAGSLAPPRRRKAGRGIRLALREPGSSRSALLVPRRSRRGAQQLSPAGQRDTHR